MHLDNFDLNLLVALDALLTEKHVTRAAEKLHVSQPAMSAALSRLRTYFDDPLLIKVGASLELTPRAEDLVGAVRDLIFRTRAVLRSEPTFEPLTGEREFRLIMSDYVSMVFVPALTRDLRRSAPNLRCLVEHLTNDTMTRVDHGVADFCITIEQSDLFDDSPVAASLSSEILFEDDFVVVLDASNPAAIEPMTCDDLLAMPSVEVRFAHTMFSLIESATRRQGLTFRSAAVAPSFTDAAALIPNTDMMTIIPHQLAKLMAPALGLAILPSPISLPALREKLIWHKRNDADPAHRWLRAQMHHVAATLDFEGAGDGAEVADAPMLTA